MPWWKPRHLLPISILPPLPTGSYALPSIDAVRPVRCPSCGVGPRIQGALNLWGHGVRWRTVVVLGERPRIASAWVRRFLCRSCGATCSVAPPGVPPRYLYVLATILMAWWDAAPHPVGDGLEDAAVYALRGVDRRKPGPEPGRAGRRRWRSLCRWAAMIPTWWPERPVIGACWRQRVALLIAGFLPGDGGRDGAVRRALLTHAAGGTAM